MPPEKASHQIQLQACLNHDSTRASYGIHIVLEQKARKGQCIHLDALKNQHKPAQGHAVMLFKANIFITDAGILDYVSLLEQTELRHHLPAVPFTSTPQQRDPLLS